MPKVTFKAKVKTVYNMDDTVAYRCVQVPELTRAHCDMSAFRMSAKFGGYANSDLFPSMLKRAVAGAGVKNVIRLDQLPDCVAIDTSGFLANVVINLCCARK